jgi:hypothetical protein
MTEPIETPQAGRDAGGWARPVTRLRASNVPEGAGDVDGRRIASPIQGFGKMWQKTYQVRLPADRAPATAVIATWKERFPDFWPTGNRFYAPLTGIAPDEVALLESARPGPVRLSTGVMVLYADEESFTLMTPQGHMFAGWMTFSATEHEGQTIARAQVLMRASDPISEARLAFGGHRQEDRFWQQALTALAAAFDHNGAVETNVVCVDRRRQWSQWGNGRRSADIGTTLHAPAPTRAPPGHYGGC